MAGVVFFDPYYSALLDADLKREAWHLVAELERATPERQELILAEIVVVRQEMINRLEDRDEGGDGNGGVREPRRPRPDAGGAQAIVFPDRDER
jgi:hypothetical protein